MSPGDGELGGRSRKFVRGRRGWRVLAIPPRYGETVDTNSGIADDCRVVIAPPRAQEGCLATFQGNGLDGETIALAGDRERQISLGKIEDRHNGQERWISTSWASPTVKWKYPQSCLAWAGERDCAILVRACVVATRGRDHRRS